jgi:hypothetical protein
MLYERASIAELRKPGEYWRDYRRRLPFHTQRALRYHLEKRASNGLTEIGAVIESPFGLLIDPERFELWILGKADHRPIEAKSA